MACTRNTRRTSPALWDHTAIASTCSALQNHHRHTVLMQVFYWPAFLCCFQSFQKSAFEAQRHWNFCICTVMCWAKKRESGLCSSVQSYIYIAPADQWLLFFASSFSPEMVFWGKRGCLTSFWQLDLETLKAHFFLLKLPGICHFRRKYFTAFIANLDPKLLGFQLSGLELWGKLSFVLVPSPLPIPLAPGFKGNFEKILLFKIGGKTISIPAWDKLHSHGGSHQVAARMPLPKESMADWEASKRGGRPVDKGTYFRHKVCGRSWPPRLFFWDAFQLRNTMPFPASASFCHRAWRWSLTASLPSAVSSTGTGRSTWIHVLVFWKPCSSLPRQGLPGNHPLPASRACVAESLSKEEQEQ